MPFRYYDRLSPARQRIYRRSDAIDRLDPPPGVAAGTTVAAIRECLAAEDRAGVQAACQQLVDALVVGYRVPPIRLRVLAKRSADGNGELHGLYEPEEGATAARITVWMRLQARIEPRERAARAGTRRRLGRAKNRVQLRPLPEERCNSRPQRAGCQARGIQIPQPRSLNRDSRTGRRAYPQHARPRKARSPTME